MESVALLEYELQVISGRSSGWPDLNDTYKYGVLGTMTPRSVLEHAIPAALNLVY